MVDEQKIRFFLGTYCEPGAYFDAKGEGLLSCTLDVGTGRIAATSACRTAGNATFMAKDPSAETLVVARDRYFSDGEVHSFAIGANGRLSHQSWATLRGQATCHVSIDRGSGHVFVSSYQDAKVSVHPFDGAVVGPAVKVLEYSGSSIDANRQESAHAHQAIPSPDGRWLYVCDLGSDKVWIHDLRRLADETSEHRSVSVPAGFGPRHLVCHPQLSILYVFCELQAKLLVCEVDGADGSFTIRDHVSTLPESYAGPASGAAIKFHPSMEILYVSNRIHNSISAFAVDKADGALTLAGRVDSRGQDPRDFDIERGGRWLLSANQGSGTVVPLELEPDSGLPTGCAGVPFDCGTPVCVVFE